MAVALSNEREETGRQVRFEERVNVAEYKEFLRIL